MRPLKQELKYWKNLFNFALMLKFVGRFQHSPTQDFVSFIEYDSKLILNKKLSVPQSAKQHIENSYNHYNITTDNLSLDVF